MKIKFRARAVGTRDHQFDGETVNGIDLSPLEHGGQFIGSAATQGAHIHDAHRDAAGVLHVTLNMPTIGSRLPDRPAHWRDSDWIDAADYDPEVCYVDPTGVADLIGGIDYTFAWAEDFTPGLFGWTINPVEADADA